MKRNLLLLLVSMSTVLGGGMAHGKECKGVSLPDQTQIEGSTLVLNGLGLRQATMLKVNVYVAALYVAQASTDADVILGATTPKQLTLHLLRDGGAADFNKGWDEGFEQNAKAQLPALKERIETLKGWMADMKTGQQMTFTYKPDAGMEVKVNGTVKGAIQGDDFAKAFLSILLGAHPPNAGLKAGLLGGDCG